MAILVITTDLKCCRCKTKIQKVLACLQGRFCIQKVEYDDKNNKVVVRGTFDAEKLRQQIWCKASKLITEIIIVEVWPLPPTIRPKKPCSPPPPPPPPPKAEYKLVPYPYPYPVPYPIPMVCQGFPWKCPPQQCHCRSEPTPPPSPPPPPPPKPCECSQDHHEHGDCGSGCCRTPRPRCGCSNHGGCGGRCKTPVWPPPLCDYKLACEDSPSYDCSLM